MSTPLGSSQWMYSSGKEVTQQSLKFNDDESQYLSWTPAAAGNRKTWTWSAWVKRGNLGTFQDVFHQYPSSGQRSQILFMSDDTLKIELEAGNLNFLRTSQVFRDASAFYNIVVVYDSANATSTDRVRLYVNGSRVTAFSTATYPSLNSQSGINTATQHEISSYDGAGYYYDGYLSDINFIDGQALDATSFGQFTNGYWEKKDYAGTYGTNGFRLTFEDDVVSEGFNTVTYRGTGATQSISGLGFEPDLVWIKERSSTSTHMLADSVRGAGKQLESSTTGAEITSSAGSRTLSSFDADGFSVEVNNQTNENNQTYVGWAWDAGSGSPVSNTNGTITSTVKANPAYGFSIVSYTGNGSSGQTVGHGLDSQPDFIIHKDRDTNGNNGSWNAWHKDAGDGDDYMYLSSTAASAGSAQIIPNGTDTIELKANLTTTNQNNHNFIMYAWHSVAGYSSIGSYSGNGSTSGPTVTTNFNPAFILVKRTDTTGNWFIWDNTRDTDGVFNTNIHPNSSAAEATSGSNFVTPSSTGFQLTGTGAETNASGGTYIYMAFADTREAAFWKDASGNNNNWTPNNLDYRDSLPDSPANNFAVLNSVHPNASTGNFSEGNLRVYQEQSPYTDFYATFAVSSGKWYWEARAAGTSPQQIWGFAREDALVTGNIGAAGSTTGYAYFRYGTLARERANGSYVNSSGALTVAAGDIIGLALNLDDNEVKFYKNGTLEHTITGVQDGTYYPFVCYQMNLNRLEQHVSFGQDSTFSGTKPMGAYTDDNGIGNFQYAPPAGFLALCTANLPDPTIVDGSEHFNTVLYTGNGTDNTSITGVGFQPDWVWLKTRSVGDNHVLNDSVRGGNRQLFSNTTDQEFTSTTLLKTFDSDGFTLGTDSAVNGSGRTLAAWNWKAGGTAVSNTDGSIASQVSANTTAGFSVATYTGTGSNATVGHGLGVAPDMVIIKGRNINYGGGIGGDWIVWHNALSATERLYLNYTNAKDTGAATTWNSTLPSSSVVSIGNNIHVNYDSSSTYVMYSFANTEGYLKAGSFTGNGSSNGPFVYTGFRPSFILTKKSSAGGDNWTIYDTARDPDNVTREYLIPNQSQAAASTDTFDILSNGFKIRTSGAWVNTSGQTYIYLAFAETPFKYANAR